MKVLLVDRYSPKFRVQLQDLSCIVDEEPNPNFAPSRLKDIEVLFIRSRTIVNKRLLAEANKLKLIITATSGFDHINWSLCQQRGITAAFCPQANINSVKELTLSFLFSFFGKVAPFNKSVQSGLWKDQLEKKQEIAGKTLGIIGMGRIGTAVANAAHNLGMNIIYHDPYIEKEAVGEPLGLTEVLRLSDVLSLHVPLTSETKELINYRTLELINEDACLINTSRGQVIQELALIEALRNKKIAGAALDVFQKEPLPEKSALLGLENIILSPHVGGFTTNALERASLEAMNTFLSFLHGKSLPHSLPPKQAWSDLVELPE